MSSNSFDLKTLSFSDHLRGLPSAASVTARAVVGVLVLLLLLLLPRRLASCRSCARAWPRRAVEAAEAAGLRLLHEDGIVVLALEDEVRQVLDGLRHLDPLQSLLALKLGNEATEIVDLPALSSAKKKQPLSWRLLFRVTSFPSVSSRRESNPCHPKWKCRWNLFILYSVYNWINACRRDSGVALWAESPVSPSNNAVFTRSLIAPQQHLPRPRRCYPTEDFLSSWCLTSMIIW